MPENGKTNKADWISAAVGLMGLVAITVGGYGKYTSDQATHDAKLEMLEKEHVVSQNKISSMEDELDVLWVDTQKNGEIIKVIRKDQERFDAAFLKFAEATDRLSISVARIETYMKIKEQKDKE